MAQAKKHLFIFLSIAAVMLSMSFKPMPANSRLLIHFENHVGDRKLALDTATYVNELGQSYTITNFKYYISNIKLTDSTGKVFENKDGYYLITEDDPNSHDIELTDVPVGNYAKITFTIGVDSLHNCNGAQSGALDPIHGMFWTWNTGYIFFKLEGKSPSSKQPGHFFEYHIGGYKEPANCIRTITLDIGSRMNDEMEVYDSGFKDRIPKIQRIDVTADIGVFLASSKRVDFSDLSSVTDFHHAPEMADKYKGMFYVSGITSGY